ncbi:transglutaminase-like domain-containing protein [Methylomonas albis]|uniref:Transglutaminase domain-containing protein n=1 Tax=Methylomonas albis TaxID=1854563 RepID=A0ABR9D1F0_9GAMM|nr:transglutaminase-like domain-containing protein [Methylomonas albis]MBD9356770.1 transglutaminase domain-containing protein [Methylomonas albis]
MPTQANIQIRKIPSGYPGTLQTVEQVCELIKTGAKDFTVRQSAIDILLQRAVKPKDYLAEIKALFEWVQQNIRYTKDTFRVEVLHSARRMLQLRAGDCDDMTILLGAMLEAIGHPVRLVLSGANPARPDQFSHIYLEVLYRGQWIPLDATMPHAMGWSSQAAVKKIVPLPRAVAATDSVTLHGLDANPDVSSLIPDLLRAISHEAFKPNDPRIKTLWHMLKRRQLLQKSAWLQAVLRRIWRQGLAAKPRPHLANRLERLLRDWRLLVPDTVSTTPKPVMAPATMQALRPVALKPVGSVRPVKMQAMRAVELPPAVLRRPRK